MVVRSTGADLRWVEEEFCNSSHWVIDESSTSPFAVVAAVTGIDAIALANQFRRVAVIDHPFIQSQCIDSVAFIKETRVVNLDKRGPAVVFAARLVVGITFPPTLHSKSIHCWRGEIGVRHARICLANPWVKGEVESHKNAFNVFIWIDLVDVFDFLTDTRIPFALVLFWSCSANRTADDCIAIAVPPCPISLNPKSCPRIGMRECAVITPVGAA